MSSFIQQAIEGSVGTAAGRAFATGTPLPDRPFADRPSPSGFEQTPLPTFTPRASPADVTPPSQVSPEDEGGLGGRSYTLSGQVLKGGPGYDYSMDISPIRGGSQFRRGVPGVQEPEFGTSYLTYLVNEKMQGRQYYDPVTGTTKSDFPGALSMAIPSPLGAIAGFGQAISQANLERIAKNAYIGEDGYAVATLNGRTIGVSPSPFGGHVLSGVLPQELSFTQRQQIANKLLEISKTEDASGAYIGPEPTAPKGQTVAEVESGAGQFTGKGDDYQQTSAQVTTPAPQVTYTSDPGDDPTSSGNQYSFPSTPTSTVSTPSYSYTAYEPFAEGGKADPIQGNGFVEGSPDNYTKSQTVADDENRQVREGSFVVNAPTVEKLQQAGMLPKGVDNSNKNATIKANKGGLMDVALSKGEYVIEPEEAQRIGYSFLENINDQGKPEVDRRQGMNKGGPAGTDLSGMPPLASGLRPPISTDTKPEGFIQTPPSMPDTGIPPMLINGINVEQVGKALSLVETRGYEDRNDGYFYTRSDTKSNPSSAFGPLQITGDTLSAMLKESDLLRIQMNEGINPGFANYLEKYATDARNKTNFRKFGLIYEGEKGKKAKGRAPTAAEKAMYKGLGTGSISLKDHKKYYPLLANIYLRYKAEMSDSEEDMVRRHFGNDKSTQKYRNAKIELGID